MSTSIGKAALIVALWAILLTPSYASESPLGSVIGAMNLVASRAGSEAVCLDVVRSHKETFDLLLLDVSKLSRKDKKFLLLYIAVNPLFDGESAGRLLDAFGSDRLPIVKELLRIPAPRLVQFCLPWHGPRAADAARSARLRLVHWGREDGTARQRVNAAHSGK